MNNAFQPSNQYGKILRQKNMLSLYVPDTCKSKEENDSKRNCKWQKVKILGDLISRMCKEFLNYVKHRHKEDQINIIEDMLCATNMMRTTNTFYKYHMKYKYTQQKKEETIIDQALTNGTNSIPTNS